MTGSEVQLLSHANWAVFWLVVVAAIVVMDVVVRRRSQTEPPPDGPGRSLWREMAGTTLPALLVAAVVMVPVQLLVQSLVPDTRAAEATEAGVSSDPVARGETIFRTKGCFGCHTIAGVSEIGTIGPELTHLASQELIADSVPYSPENLREWLQNPHELKPGTEMPNMNLSAEDLDVVVAYLDTLK